MSIADNIEAVKANIAGAAAEYPRFSAPSVQLIAVTKTLGVDKIREA